MIYRVGGYISGFALEYIAVGVPLGSVAEIRENCEALDAVFTNIYEESIDNVFVSD